MKKLARSLTLGLLFLAGCQTSPTANGPTEIPGAANPGLPAPPGTKKTGPLAVNLTALQHQIGMDRNIRDLGFEEKSFDTCQMGLSAAPDCERKYLTVIHFRLQCRESEGTDQNLTNASIHNLQSADVRWNLGKSEGFTETDFEGYGQALVMTSRSQKRERFKLTLKGQFLVLTAESVNRIVAPGSWCKGQR